MTNVKGDLVLVHKFLSPDVVLAWPWNILKSLLRLLDPFVKASKIILDAPLKLRAARLKLRILISPPSWTLLPPGCPGSNNFLPHRSERMEVGAGWSFGGGGGGGDILCANRCGRRWPDRDPNSLHGKALCVDVSLSVFDLSTQMPWMSREAFRRLGVAGALRLSFVNRTEALMQSIVEHSWQQFHPLHRDWWPWHSQGALQLGVKSQ